jgi:hypothetical protein
MANLLRRARGGSAQRPGAGACAAVLLVTIASCSGADRPPAAPVTGAVTDSGTDDSTTGSDDIGPTHDATTPTDDASEASSDDADDASDASSDDANDATLDAPVEAEAEASAPEAGVDASFDAGAGDAGAADGGDGASNACSSANDDADVVYQMCGTHCVNTDTDNNNCGGCGQSCGLVVGTSCDEGQCQCAAPQVVCNNQCVDITSDSANCGFCGHNCQGTACSLGLCVASPVATVTDSVCVLSGLAVDSTTVYWTQGSILNTGCTPGTFAKPFAGGSTITYGSTEDPRGVVVDLTNVYWVDYIDGSLRKAPLAANGGGGTSIFPAVDLEAGTTPGPVALAIDAHNVYWADSAAGTVNQMPLAGGTVTVLATGSWPNAVAVDSKVLAKNVYWVDYVGGTVNKVPVAKADGGTPVNVVLAPSETQPWNIAIDATNVYWTDKSNPGSVKSIGINGTNPVTLAQGLGAPWGIAVDANFVYWTNFNDNTVVKTPIGGGTVYTLASEPQQNPAAIAVDNVSVYWVDQGGGNILKVAK